MMASATRFRAPRRFVVAVVAVVASLVLLLAFAAVRAPAADAQATSPTIGDTARLLGYLWADGKYDDASGVWDATGPSGGSELIQQLVINHGGTWVDRSQLKFTLPSPYDWPEWKGSLPNDDARTREAVQHPNFLAALLEGEGSTAGLVYDQSSCCTAGFTGGRLTDLHQLLRDRGFSTATITMFNDVDSGRINIAASDFIKLRANHQFVCPSVSGVVRIPGGENNAAHGPIQWFDSASDYADVVRTDCTPGQRVTDAGPPVGDCIATSDGNGKLRLTWSFKRGTVSIFRNGTFVAAASSLDKVFVDSPAAGTHTYTVRVLSVGLLTENICATVSTNDAYTAPPVAGVTCMGQTITHLGTGGADIIDATAGPDVIHGFGGDDEIFGRQGNDLICAGSGSDTVRAGQGNDIVWGGQGFDVLYGAEGNDVLRAVGWSITDLVGGSRMYGGMGNDVIEGSTRWDRMQGGPGNDVLRGYTGRDWMRGGPGNDQMIGGGAIDDIHGGNDMDFIQIEASDIVRGGAGVDGCLYDTPAATVLSCETTLTNATKAAFINRLN